MADVNSQAPIRLRRTLLSVTNAWLLILALFGHTVDTSFRIAS